jgi:hypothetical protein
MKEIVSKVIDYSVSGKAKEAVVGMLKYTPVAVQSQRFAVTAETLSNSTNPVSAAISGIKLISDVCLPPNIKYPLKCAVLFAQIGISIYSGGTSTILTTTLALGSARQILEELY